MIDPTFRFEDNDPEKAAKSIDKEKLNNYGPCISDISAKYNIMNWELPDLLSIKNLNVSKAALFFITGHGHFASVLHRITLRYSSLCCHCGEENETPDHLLFKCPSFSKVRTDLFTEGFHLLNTVSISPSDFGKDSFSWNLFKRLLQLVSVSTLE